MQDISVWETPNTLRICLALPKRIRSFVSTCGNSSEDFNHDSPRSKSWHPGIACFVNSPKHTVAALCERRHKSERKSGQTGEFPFFRLRISLTGKKGIHQSDPDFSCGHR